MKRDCYAQIVMLSRHIGHTGVRAREVSQFAQFAQSQRARTHTHVSKFREFRGSTRPHTHAHVSQFGEFGGSTRPHT